MSVMAHREPRESRPRGRSPALADDALDNDNWTVYSDTESSVASDRASRHIPCSFTQEHAPRFYLQSEDVDKPAYEAWDILYLPDKVKPVGFLGGPGTDRDICWTRWVATCTKARPSVPSELVGTHFQAVVDFRARHKRCWARRVIPGRAKTYEEDLEERCAKLPKEVQSALTQLLSDRDQSTSTHYRTRTWTVVAMREQLRDRFTKTELAEVKRHRFRFWKNPDPYEHLVYTFIIRGAETKVLDGEDHFCTFEREENPWKHADIADTSRRRREETVQQDTPRGKQPAQAPSSRSGLERSISPPSYRTWSSRTGSPAPSTRDSRLESPPPYRRWYHRSASSSRSRSPAPRIRVRPRRAPSISDVDPVFPQSPTPPYSYTPPPAVSAYTRPSIAAAFPAGPSYSTSPLQPRPQPPFASPAGASAPTMPTVPLNAGPFGPQPPPHPVAHACPGCRVTGCCAHYPPFLLCRRPVAWYLGMPYHPPCLFCAKQRLEPLNLSAPPPPPPSRPGPGPGLGPGAIPTHPPHIHQPHLRVPEPWYQPAQQHQHQHQAHHPPSYPRPFAYPPPQPFFPPNYPPPPSWHSASPSPSSTPRSRSPTEFASSSPSPPPWLPHRTQTRTPPPAPNPFSPLSTPPLSSLAAPSPPVSVAGTAAPAAGASAVESEGMGMPSDGAGGRGDMSGGNGGGSGCGNEGDGAESGSGSDGEEAESGVGRNRFTLR